MSANVPNRKYTFKKIKVQDAKNPLVYTDLNMKDNLVNTFIVQPSKTWIDWVPPTDEQVSNYYLKNFSIKIKSDDKAFENNKRVRISFKSQYDSDKRKIEYTGKLSRTSENGDETTIENIQTKDLLGNRKYYIEKIELLDELSYANKTNKIIYQCGSKAKYSFDVKKDFYKLEGDDRLWIRPWYDSVKNQAHFKYYVYPTNWCKNGFKNINAKFKVVFHRNDGTSTDDELVASNLSLIKDEEKNQYYIEGILNNIIIKNHYRIKNIYVSNPTSDNLFDENNNERVSLDGQYNSGFSSYEIESQSSFFGSNEGSSIHDQYVIKTDQDSKKYYLSLRIDHRYHDKYLRAVFEYYDSKTNKYEYLYTTPIKLDFFNKNNNGYSVDFEKSKNIAVWKGPERIFKFKGFEYSEDLNSNNWKTFKCKMNANNLGILTIK